MNPQLIPAVDPAGIPGPAWLFHFLLVLTFFLHLLFLNLTVGGTLLALVSRLRSSGDPGDPRGVLAGRLVAVNTYGISLTITTGVAPLLFMQVLYHQFFYSATILLGGAWFSLLIALAVGYYAVYVFKIRGSSSSGSGSSVWLGIAAVMFLLIAAIQVSVNLAGSQPGLWQRLAANPWSVVTDPSFVPRLLHFVLAGVAFAALVALWWAVRKAREGQEVELNSAIAAHSLQWVLWVTLAQVLDGILLLLLLPRPVLGSLMQGGAAMLLPLGLAVALGVGLLVMIARVQKPVDQASLISGVLATALVVIAVMSITRHQVRQLYLLSATELPKLEVAPGIGNFLLFAVILVLALATVAYMVRKVLTSPATGEDAA